MSWKIFVFAMVVAFWINTPSYAVDTTRYALITPTAKTKALPLPALKSSGNSKVPYARIPERGAPGTIKVKDENLINWTPMSIEALGYDIREVWRDSAREIWLGVGPR